ncbi:histidine phosphatase family protein [Roseivirga sp. E12]|uniref:SixA phosphatase family protein n=1 Tax=Roseivirga sp. E12 TaxID=2819237 RepID=UPI001ABCCA51|nr:phosphoglycerate mutase family protein [Roseivirga sp. E12]MBO3697317.1 histidine phosphatase family protein [Roseivirga sp. E12]
MKRIALILFISALSINVNAQTDVTTFILVRHAEKSKDDPRDPSLSEEGIKRAKALNEILTQADIAALYSTPYKRTKSTVQPIADAKGLEITIYDPRSADFLKDIMEKYKGKTVVISGHSNTTPLVANLLTGSDQFKQLSEDDYSKIYMVSVTELGKGTATILTY